MKNPFPYLALIAASFSPIMAEAQNSGAPGYTFGGMFPGMFGGNNYGMPQGIFNNGQNPFLTMPAPQYPMANPQYPSAPNTQAPTARFPANPMAQPTPFWMQTPANQQPPARFITDVPSNSGAQNQRPSYSFFGAPAFRSAPPRWAPLPGQAATPFHAVRPHNNWAMFPNMGQTPVPAIPVVPPKWATE